MCIKRVKLQTYFALLSLAWLCVSCERSQPDAVVENFYSHFYRGEYDKAGELVTNNSKIWFETMQKYALENQSEQNIRIENIKCQITNDTSAICFCDIISNEKNLQTIVHLKKEGNEWKVDIGFTTPEPTADTSKTTTYLFDETNIEYDIAEDTEQEEIIQNDAFETEKIDNQEDIETED
ncbi:MAG: hypothetical protein LBR36_08095 [Bacteroidales bacterium]|jgi:hypothetical protein|nr:hypothetical protein [Bacteroidales bacterium]